MPASPILRPEDMSSCLKREEPVPDGEDAVFWRLALQIALSGEANLSGSVRGLRMAPERGACRWDLPEGRGLASCPVPDLGVRLLPGI